MDCGKFHPYPACVVGVGLNERAHTCLPLRSRYTAAMTLHDESYRLLFNFREMVADLLAGFLPPDWVAALDLASLEPLSASYVGDRLERRDGDRLWRCCFSHYFTVDFSE